MSYFAHFRAALERALEATTVTDLSGRILTTTDGLDQITAVAQQLRTNAGAMYFCGNGASSAMAGHMALDWLKAGEMKAISFNDSAVLTAVANDTGYENVFSLPISRLGRAGDLLVTISSSGNSPNVLTVIPVAREKGMKVISFSGLKPDNRSRVMGDFNFYVPCKTYGIAECCHQILLHAWLDQFLGITTEWTEGTP